jgi:hypothetical protein
MITCPKRLDTVEEYYSHLLERSETIAPKGNQSWELKFRFTCQPLLRCTTAMLMKMRTSIKGLPEVKKKHGRLYKKQS